MKKSGFTLIELLMASVILAILAGIAIPNYTRSQLRAEESEVKSVTHSLQMAVEDYKTTPGQEGIKPASASDLNVVLDSYLPINVQLRRNPFNQVQSYGSGGGGIVFARPAGLGMVGYEYTSQTSPYTISSWGGNPNVIILTLIEGQ